MAGIDKQCPRQIMPGRENGHMIEIGQARCVEHDHTASRVRGQELGCSIGLVLEETQEAQSSRMARLGGGLTHIHRQITA